jgi:hypothetical protein
MVVTDVTNVTDKMGQFGMSHSSLLISKGKEVAALILGIQNVRNSQVIQLFSTHITYPYHIIGGRVAESRPPRILRF